MMPPSQWRRSWCLLAVCAVAHGLSPEGRAPALHQRPHVERAIQASERRAVARVLSEARPQCPRCARPPAVCVCDSLPERPLATRTRLVVLQHPDEFRRRHSSTVPLLPLCLENCEIKVGYSFDADAIATIRDAKRRPLLLFPSPDAAPLEDVVDDVDGDGDGDGDGDDGRVLVVIDGTWAKAKRAYRASPSLRDRTRPVMFRGAATSALHVLRREPESHCISTLEAAAAALRVLEPTAAVATATGHLEASLRLMVDHQLAAVRERPSPRFPRRPSAGS